MHIVACIFAGLSSLLMAAHFLRAGQNLIAGSCLLLPLLLILRRTWATRLVQMTLLLGALAWLWTMVRLAEVFDSAARPAGRMMVILTSVAAFTFVSALLLQFRLPRPPRPASRAS